MRVKIIINIRLCSSISLCKFNSISSSQSRFISILEKMNSRLKLIVRRIPRETYRTKYFKPRDLSMEFLNGTDPIDSRFQTWSQVKSPCPCFRFAKKDVTRWFCVPVYDRKNDFPWTRWRSGTGKKKETISTAKARSIVTITIGLSRIRIELRDRSLEKKNYAVFVKDGELLYLFVYDFVI